MLNSRAQHQILDGGQGSVSLAASASGSVQASGTVWPLLPHSAARVYHVSCNVLPNSAGVVELNGLSIQCDILDAAGSSVNGTASLFLASGNYPANTILGNASGGTLGESGDPLIQLASGFLVANATGNPPASIQIFALADLTNTDAVNPQTVSIFLAVLLAFSQLG